MQLQFGGDSRGGVSKAMPLPPGQAPPEDWVPIGSRRTAPRVDPQRSGGSASAGDTGRSGSSWQLRVAPRHRAVVRRVFSAEGRK